VISKLTGVESAYEIPDVLWDKTVPLLPPPRKKKKKAGRPRMDDRKAMSAIFSVFTYRLSVECTSKKSWYFKYST
jgi:hypothetical protein